MLKLDAHKENGRISISEDSFEPESDETMTNSRANTEVKQLIVTPRQRKAAIRRASINVKNNKAWQDTKAYISELS